jgi:hypothetical protein
VTYSEELEAFRGVILVRFEKSFAGLENERKLWASTKVRRSGLFLANARCVEASQELPLRCWRRIGETVRVLSGSGGDTAGAES